MNRPNFLRLFQKHAEYFKFKFEKKNSNFDQFLPSDGLAAVAIAFKYRVVSVRGVAV